VDRQRRRVRELVLPASGLEAGLQQHPVADGPDQALLLGQGDERRRGRQALDRVVPAGQRLDPGDAARHQLDDRLVVQHQLVAVGHVAQLGLQLQALEDVLVHVGPEQLVAVLASGLGRVHGHVGVAQQLVGLVRARPVGRWPRQGWP
jgi:hypothetical protein